MVGGRGNTFGIKEEKRGDKEKKKKEKQRGHSCFIEICVYVSILPVCAQ